MEVKMLNGLTSITAAIGYNSVSVAESERSGNFGYLDKYVLYVFDVFCRNAV